MVMVKSPPRVTPARALVVLLLCGVCGLGVLRTTGQPLDVADGGVGKVGGEMPQQQLAKQLAEQLAGGGIGAGPSSTPVSIAGITFHHRMDEARMARLRSSNPSRPACRSQWPGKAAPELGIPITELGGGLPPAVWALLWDPQFMSEFGEMYAKRPVGWDIGATHTDTLALHPPPCPPPSRAQTLHPPSPSPPPPPTVQKCMRRPHEPCSRDVYHGALLEPTSDYRERHQCRNDHVSVGTVPNISTDRCTHACRRKQACTHEHTHERTPRRQPLRAHHLFPPTRNLAGADTSCGSPRQTPR